MFWLVAQSSATAQSVGSDARLSAFSYDVPEGCPNRAEFLRLVAEKRSDQGTSPLQPESVLAALRVFAEKAYVARLEFQPGIGTNRRLEAATCQDVLAGAALVVALGLASVAQTEAAAQDTRGETDDRQQPTVPELAESPDAGAPGVSSPLSASAEQQDAHQPYDARDLHGITVSKQRTGAVTSTREPSEQVPTLDPPTPVSFHIGGSGGFNNWVAPTLVPELRAFVELAPTDMQWAVRVVGYRAFGSTRLDDRAAHFDAWGARLDFTPVVLGEARTWRLALTGLMDVGLLRARGDAASDLANANTGRFWWVAPGAGVRVSTPEWSHAHLELQGDALVPLRRPEFTFEQPLQTVHAPRAVALGAHVALSIRVN
jgi:hypothetical protein